MKKHLRHSVKADYFLCKDSKKETWLQYNENKETSKQMRRQISLEFTALILCHVTPVLFDFGTASPAPRISGWVI
jgi:hypothetical protein